MKERPILFSGEMVVAILEGRKTQTRRVIKLRDFNANTQIPWGGEWEYRDARGNWWDVSTKRLIEKFCPYGKQGDRLWVRETFGLQLEPCEDYPKGYVIYKADGGDFQYEGGGSAWTPSIFMPRWASRITLDILSVRVERLQNISCVDSMAEGSPDGANPQVWFTNEWDTVNFNRPEYWWSSNPWVWAIEFKVVEK
jgi:hypothetical protein